MDDREIKLRSIKDCEVHKLYGFKDWEIDYALSLLKLTRRLNIIGTSCSGRHTLAENLCMKLLYEYSHVDICDCTFYKDLKHIFDKANTTDVKGALVVFLSNIGAIENAHDLFRNMPSNVYIIAISNYSSIGFGEDYGYFISFEIKPLIHNRYEFHNLVKDFSDDYECTVLDAACNMLIRVTGALRGLFGENMYIGSDAIIKAIDNKDAKMLGRVLYTELTTKLKTQLNSSFAYSKDAVFVNELLDALDSIAVLGYDFSTSSVASYIKSIEREIESKIEEKMEQARKG